MGKPKKEELNEELGLLEFLFAVVIISFGVMGAIPTINAFMDVLPISSDADSVVFTLKLIFVILLVILVMIGLILKEYTLKRKKK